MCAELYGSMYCLSCNVLYEPNKSYIAIQAGKQKCIEKSLTTKNIHLLV